MDKLANEQLNQELTFLMLEVILETDKNANLTKAQQWDEEVVIDDIDYGVMKLVPLYLRKLKEIGFHSNHEKRLKVLHKYWWLKTLKNLDRLAEVVEALTGKNKVVMVINGVPVLAYYDENVLRPMADLDILIHREEVLDSISMLESIGWKSTESAFLKRLRKAPGLCLDFKHSIQLVHPKENTKMNLHWKVGNYASWELTSQVWKNAQNSSYFPKAKEPELSDLLCMEVLHSVDFQSKNHYNWIVDISKMQADLTDEIWNKARRLAQSELKENWFDYGCFLLQKFGIRVPFRSQVKDVPFGRLRKIEFGNKLNLPRYLVKKIQNNLIILSINFPHDYGFQKVYRMIRRMAYFRLNRAG